jgi:hypothetical protein
MATVNSIGQRIENPFQFFLPGLPLTKPMLPAKNLVENDNFSELKAKLVGLEFFLEKCRLSNIDKNICDLVYKFLEEIKSSENSYVYDINFVASTTLDGEIALDIHFEKIGLSTTNLLSLLFRKQGIKIEGRRNNHYYDIYEELGKEHLTVQELLVTFKDYATL